MSKYLLVHSRGASGDAKYLSSFAPCNIQYNDRNFPTIENAFQAAKLEYVSGLSDLSEIYKQFENVQPAQAKKLGSKSSFKKLGITLDVHNWNINSTRIMTNLIQLRSEVDPLFLSIRRKYDKIYHYERSGSKSYWGGYFDKKTKQFVGQNMYGQLLGAKHN